MNRLIEALQILEKYLDKETYEYKNPTCCLHDILITAVKGPVSDDDAIKLEELGFFVSEEYETWCSFDFGSN